MTTVVTVNGIPFLLSQYITKRQGQVSSTWKDLGWWGMIWLLCFLCSDFKVPHFMMLIWDLIHGGFLEKGQNDRSIFNGKKWKYFSISWYFFISKINAIIQKRLKIMEKIYFESIFKFFTHFPNSLYPQIQWLFPMFCNWLTHSQIRYRLQLIWEIFRK